MSTKFRLRNGNELTIPNFIANANFESSQRVKKVYQEQLKQFQQIKRGTPSKQVPESEIKAAGTYVNTQQ